MRLPCGSCGDCYLCTLYRTRPDYRASIDAHPAPAVGASARTGCAHLGGPTGELRECPTCCGTVRIKLMACAVYGSCSSAKPLPGLACCAGHDGKPCPSYAPKPP